MSNNLFGKIKMTYDLMFEPPSEIQLLRQQNKQLMEYIIKIEMMRPNQIIIQDKSDYLSKFFKENEDIKPYFEAASSELIADGCYSLHIIYVRAIEKVLESLTEREEINGKSSRYTTEQSNRDKRI
jgi:hypothetical protein